MGVDGVSLNPTLTLDFVLKHRNKEWCWEHISSAIDIAPEDVDTHPELQWSWRWLSRNPFGTSDRCNLKAMELESRKRIIARTKVFKEDLMMYCWNPARANVWWTTEGLDEDM
jgi:hypothetical protein